MSDVDQRLLEVAVSALRSLQSLAGTEGWDWQDNEIIAKTVLECFTVRDEFRCMDNEDADLTPPHMNVDDRLAGRVFSSAAEVAEAMQADPGRQRQMQHRWVAETEWAEVTAHLDWEYDR